MLSTQLTASQVGFQPWSHIKLVRKFGGNPLRDGRDSLSRIVDDTQLYGKSTYIFSRQKF